MPVHIRAMCQWQVGSMLPRDINQITPCFRHQILPASVTPEWQDLADDLAQALEAWDTGGRQLTVKLYNIDEEAPGHINRPKATTVIGAGLASPSPYPPEVACCLSFYGGNNEPRQRGRLYVPPAVASTEAQANRPGATLIGKVHALGPIFANLGGVNCDWIVWSKANESATAVTDYFVDDEWDVVRKRGLVPVARVTGTTSEA